MMKYTLKKKPKNVTIIQGFPSLGLVSTITIKFLIDHLDVEELGYIESEGLVPLMAVHKSQIVNPITLYYNKKFNIVLLQSITEVNGLEWELAKTIVAIAKELKAKEVIVVEAIPSREQKVNVSYYSSKAKMHLDPVKEGIMMGVTAAMMLKARNQVPLTCLFAEAHSQLPDYEVAAKVVQVLDDHLGLKVDFKPLVETAKKFEHSLKQYMQKAKESAPQNTAQMQQKEKLNYFG